MSGRVDLLGSVRNVLGGLFGVLGYLCRFAWLMLVPKAVLAAKTLAAQSQWPPASMRSTGSKRRNHDRRSRGRCRAGSKVTAYVNPDDPSESVLSREREPAIAIMIAGGVFGLAGAGILAAALVLTLRSAGQPGATGPGDGSGEGST